jgi:CheY-like chemotaxis protein
MTTVLIVDDEAPQRAQLDRALTQAGYQVDSAACGNQALTRLKEKRYDLLITDLMMDEGTGFEVLEWVRENAPGLPVIVCSSYAKSETLKTLLTTQLFRTVRKPFRPDDLMEQVRKLLEGIAD